MSSSGSCSGTLHKRATQRGFSLVEGAIALVVAGLMTWAAFSGYVTVSEQQEIERGRAEAEQLQSILRAFALRNGRLPCPASKPDGYEALSSGVCASGVQLGWFPYVSVGLELPTDRLRARYSVFREANLAVPAQDADLAVELERTGDSLGAPTHRDITDLIVALNNASTKPVSSTRTYLTGDGGAAGAIDCAANRVMVAAYWVVVPLQDKDGDGNRLDAPHTLTSLCAASPSAPLRFASDDVVIAESPAQLAGWLRKSLP